MTITHAYCDGGLVGNWNPSRLGGVWAFCWVDDGGDRVHGRSGAFTPADLGMELISNNIMELLAAVLCIESLPEDWDGVLCTDSSITLARMTTGDRFANVPRWLIDRTRQARVGRNWHARLVAGHPNRTELRDGVKRKNGLPTSPHNVWCDQECKRRKGTLKVALP